MSTRELTKKEVAAGTRAPELGKLELRLTSLSALPGGLVAFTLENGQVWRQLSTSADLLLHPGDIVTISRGALGSYTLRTATGRYCKVKRVR